MNKNKLLLLTIGVLGAFGFAFSGSATLPASAAEQAASEESILLSPTSKRYEVAAGSSTKDSFKVVNDGEASFTFFVYARPYSVDNEDYAANFENEVKNADAYKWVQFDKASYDLAPGESVDVGYTFRVPKGASPGGHYGVLFAETQPNQQVSGTVIAQKKRVGAILYATIDGNVTKTGKFVAQDVPLFQFNAPLKIRQKLSNGGNTDFIVRSSVSVSDVFGAVKFKTVKDVTILPSTTRSINNDWVNPAWIGLYKVEQNAKYLDTSKSTTSYVLLVPVWLYVLTALLIGARVLYAVARRKSNK